MGIELGLLDRAGGCLVNTQHASLAALLAHYQGNETLKPLASVDMAIKSVDYTPASKLQQVMLSMLAGCEYISEVNTQLRPDTTLARVWQLEQFAEQSTLSRTLDELTLKQIEQLRAASTTIWRQHSQTVTHDWRGFLWLDFDLSGLPCGKQGEGSLAGYFSGKKTSPGANSHGSVSLLMARPSGRRCSQATATP